MSTNAALNIHLHGYDQNAWIKKPERRSLLIQQMGFDVESDGISVIGCFIKVSDLLTPSLDWNGYETIDLDQVTKLVELISRAYLAAKAADLLSILQISEIQIEPSYLASGPRNLDHCILPLPALQARMKDGDEQCILYILNKIVQQDTSRAKAASVAA